MLFLLIQCRLFLDKRGNGLKVKAFDVFQESEHVIFSIVSPVLKLRVTYFAQFVAP